MTTIRRQQDKYGSYQLTAYDKFIESLIIRAIGDETTARFRKDIYELALGYGGWQFGYFADRSQSKGYSGDAEKEIVKAYQICAQCGCVIDAMLVTSPLVKSQMQRVSDTLDIFHLISDYLKIAKKPWLLLKRLSIKWRSRNNSTALQCLVQGDPRKLAFAHLVNRLTCIFNVHTGIDNFLTINFNRTLLNHAHGLWCWGN